MMQHDRSHAALFLDRDGTIIEDVGCVREVSQVRFFPFTVPTLKKLGEYYELFIVTSQPGVSQSIVTMEEVETVNDFVVATLAERGIAIRAVYVCPHQTSDDCRCKKPKPHFLYQAEADFGLDLSSSFVVGDHPSDVRLAANAGAQGLYVLTGHGVRHLGELLDDRWVFESLAEAGVYVLATRSVEKTPEDGLSPF
ncbi:MAG: HAD-IIIA family hydrolase [bacterium]